MAVGSGPVGSIRTDRLNLTRQLGRCSSNGILAFDQPAILGPFGKHNGSALPEGRGSSVTPCCLYRVRVPVEALQTRAT
jgi:hypothetical protein